MQATVGRIVNYFIRYVDNNLCAFPAIIVNVNEDSVDLNVFTNIDDSKVKQSLSVEIAAKTNWGPVYLCLNVKQGNDFNQWDWPVKI